MSNKDLEVTKSIAAAYQSMYAPAEEVVAEEAPVEETSTEEVVEEGKKLDPVGKEDDDVDNDGDTDAADKYLKKKRAAITKAVKKEEVCPECGKEPCECDVKEGVEVDMRKKGYKEAVKRAAALEAKKCKSKKEEVEEESKGQEDFEKLHKDNTKKTVEGE